jgi:hypothetical protein
MRRLLLVTIIGFVSASPIRYQLEEQIDLESKEIQIEMTQPNIELQPVIHSKHNTDLVTAMIWVESKGNDSAYHKREKAAGCLQIRPIMVKEVNRILTLKGSDKIYTLEDRWSRAKSIQMFNIVSNYYHPNGTYEEIARCWNGGPQGLQKKQTQKYWRKVQTRIKHNENSTNRSTNL